MGTQWSQTPDDRYSVPEQRNGPPEFYTDRDGDYRTEGAVAWVDVLLVLVIVVSACAVVVRLW